MSTSSVDVTHLEWELINFTGQVQKISFLSEVSYTLKLRRRTGYLTYMFVVPASVMALLVPVPFLLPPESGEKLTLGEE